MMIFSDIKHIVGGVCPSPGVALSVAPAHAAVGSIVSRADVAAERLVEVLYVLYTDIALKRQSLYRHNLKVCVAENAPR